METIKSRWTQPHGTDVRIGYGAMVDGTGWWCIRRVNFREQELWNGWPLQTIQRVLEEWDAFERKIGSRWNPFHYGDALDALGREGEKT